MARRRLRQHGHSAMCACTAEGASEIYHGCIGRGRSLPHPERRSISQFAGSARAFSEAISEMVFLSAASSALIAYASSCTPSTGNARSRKWHPRANLSLRRHLGSFCQKSCGPGELLTSLLEYLGNQILFASPYSALLSIFNKLPASIRGAHTLYEYITITATFCSFAAVASAVPRSAAEARSSTASHLILRLAS